MYVCINVYEYHKYWSETKSESAPKHILCWSKDHKSLVQLEALLPCAGGSTADGWSTNRVSAEMWFEIGLWRAALSLSMMQKHAELSFTVAPPLIPLASPYPSPPSLPSFLPPSSLKVMTEKGAGGFCNRRSRPSIYKRQKQRKHAPMSSFHARQCVLRSSRPVPFKLKQESFARFRKREATEWHAVKDDYS